ncbi:outer membrane beta-barrel protein [Flocculibacter collagenilyticus]|uniref:outer membrane beta-barrel protein n=1 Tax=Flocculibacter collagenilyticus TaxID=2744479 RepID=UPI0018F60488|nr:outer membrane beta-barrel protein [Flocculibacter collagenilyticus]
MKLQKLFTTLACFSILSWNVAAESVYVGAFTSYGKIENEGRNSDNSAIKVVTGLRIHPQWAIELGYADLGEVEEVRTVFVNVDTDTSNTVFKNGFEGEGISLSLLGIASSQAGQLYYKIGATKLDATQVVYGQTTCSGTYTVVENNNRCEKHLNDNALTFGLGWEQNLSKSWRIRTEYERMHAEGDLTIQNAYLGVVYAF